MSMFLHSYLNNSIITQIFVKKNWILKFYKTKIMVKFKVNILKKDLLLTPFHLTYHKYKYLNCILQLSLYICQGNIIC